MSSQKRTYKVVTVLGKSRLSVVYIVADKMMVTTSGALCFYEHRKTPTDLRRKLCGAYHLVEAHAPGTWKHVVEGEVEEEEGLEPDEGEPGI